MSKERIFKWAQQQLTEKRHRDLVKARKVRRAEETAAKFTSCQDPTWWRGRRCSQGQPHSGAFRNMAGEGRMVVQALSCQSALRKQPSQVLTHQRGENKHNRKQETWNGRHDSSVWLAHKWKRKGCGEVQENSVCGSGNPRSGALPYLGTIIDLSDLPEQQSATHQPRFIACFTLYICRRLYLLQSRLQQKQ